MRNIWLVSHAVFPMLPWIVLDFFFNLNCDDFCDCNYALYGTASPCCKMNQLAARYTGQGRDLKQLCSI